MNKIILFTVFLASALAVAGCKSPTAPTNPSSSNTAKVSGTVKDSASGTSIAGATVSLYNSNAASVLVGTKNTDASGNYEFDSLSAGKYYIVASEQGFNTQTDTVTVTTTANATANFQLGTAKITGLPALSGSIKAASTGSVISGATVTLYTSGSVLVSTTQSNAAGYYAFDTVNPGKYIVTAGTNRYAAHSDTVTVVAGSNVTANFQLSNIADLQIAIQSQVTGGSIDTAYVIFDGDTILREIPTPSGYVDLQLAEGPHRLQVAAPGFITVDTSIILSSLITNFYLANMRESIAPDTLIAEYTFSNSAIDSSGHGHNGTNHGGAYVADRFGIAQSALQLNGSTDYISVADAPDFDFGKTGSFTICFWAKYSLPQYEGSGEPIVVHKGTGFESSFTGYTVYIDGYYNNFEIGTTYGTANGQQEEVGGDTRWHFFVYTFDRTGPVGFYYDGVQQYYFNYSSNGIQGNLNTTAPLLIGGDGTAQNSYKGTLDDIRIFKGVVQAPEINTLYHENGW